MSTDERPGAPNALRGIAIVVVAGVLGLFLLSRGGTTQLTGGSEPVGGKTTTTVAAVPTIPPEPTTTPPPATNPPAEVSVAVFNGTGGKVPGAAGNTKAKLTPLGYSQVAIYDTAETEKSAVYYQDGHQGDATAIAKDLGLDAGAVAPAANAQNLPAQGASSNVVVIIGKDAPS